MLTSSFSSPMGSQRKRRDLSQLAERAYELIRQAGQASMTQAALGKQLGLDPKPVSRIVAKLLEQGRIVRQPVCVERKLNTYRLKPTERGKRVASKLFFSRHGRLQSGLHALLGCDESSTKRTVESFVRRGWLVRQPLSFKSKFRTWQLRVVGPRTDLASVADVPCFSCVDIDRCAPGMELDPTSCQRLDGWLAEQVR